jgi:hypothetical protein
LNLSVITLYYLNRDEGCAQENKYNRHIFSKRIIFGRDFAQFIKYSVANDLILPNQHAKTKIKVFVGRGLNLQDINSFLQKYIKFACIVKQASHRNSSRKQLLDVYVFAIFKKTVFEVSIAKRIWKLNSSKFCSSLITLINLVSMFPHGKIYFCLCIKKFLDALFYGKPTSSCYYDIKNWYADCKKRCMVPSKWPLLSYPFLTALPADEESLSIDTVSPIDYYHGDKYKLEN